jgi:catechol 2,3-dioxygenase-like lactoylglutathione lyase family enzyme
MSWQVNDAELASVLALPADRRYEFFVKRAASHGQLWGLRGGDGWVTAEDDEGDQHFPVWPHPRFAQTLATGPWSDAAPMAIDIDEWVEEWLSELDGDGIRIAVFQTPADQGVSVPPARLQRDLKAELEQFDL